MSDNDPRTYAGTTGWSGGDTSRDRAQREALDGTAESRGEMIYLRIRYSAAFGLTAQELCNIFGLTHGQVSGVLTNLQRKGRVTRLARARNRQQPYVLPEHVMSRDTVPYMPNSSKVLLEYRLEKIRSLIDDPNVMVSRAMIRRALESKPPVASDYV